MKWHEIVRLLLDLQRWVGGSLMDWWWIGIFVRECRRIGASFQDWPWIGIDLVDVSRIFGGWADIVQDWEMLWLLGSEWNCPPSRLVGGSSLEFLFPFYKRKGQMHWHGIGVGLASCSVDTVGLSACSTSSLEWTWLYDLNSSWIGMIFADALPIGANPWSVQVYEADSVLIGLLGCLTRMVRYASDWHCVGELAGWSRTSGFDWLSG